MTIFDRLARLIESTRPARDGLRAALAWPFGTFVRGETRRLAVFVAVYAAVFLAVLLSPWPRVAVAVAGVALVCLTAAYREWAADETRRGRVAKKIDPVPSAEPADLRLHALLTAVGIALLLPPALARADAVFTLFSLVREPGMAEWYWFVLDKTYLRALPDTIDLYFARLDDLHGHVILYRDGTSGNAGKTAVSLMYFLVGVTLVQAFFRVWQIRRDVAEGVEGVKEDADMAVRLGKRAVAPLLTMWRRGGLDDDVRRNVLVALGRIGDPRAFGVILGAARTDSARPVQEAAYPALADLVNRPENAKRRAEAVGVFGHVLTDRRDDHSAESAAAAAVALGRVREIGALKPLLKKLEQIHDIDKRYKEEANVRKEVLRSVGRQLGERRRAGEMVGPEIDRALRHILKDDLNSSLLEDVYLRVRNKAAGALAELSRPQALDALTERLADQRHQNPKLLAATLDAIAALLREPGAEGYRAGAAAETWQQLKNSENDAVRQAAAKALGETAARDKTGELLAMYEKALREEQEDLAEALGQCVNSLDETKKSEVGALKAAHGRWASQERRRRLLNRELAEEVRIGAAAEMVRFADARAIPALRRAANSEKNPDAVREACRQALATLEANEADANKESER